MSDKNYKHSFTRVSENGEEYVKLTLELRIRHKGLAVLPQMSITGEAGYICSEESAQEQALESWVSYFEEVGEGETLTFLRDHSLNCNADDIEREAANHVVNTDGEYHGLDVDFNLSEDDKVYVVTSCGQIRDEITSSFPEMVPYMRHHLNDMRASQNGEAWLFEQLPANLEDFMTAEAPKLEDL